MNTIDLQHKIGEQLNFCDTKNDRGIKFRFVVIETGRAYGRDCCLINNDAPLVEVWDMQMPQFVSRYYISTLIDGTAFDNGIKLRWWRTSMADRSTSFDSRETMDASNVRHTQTRRQHNDLRLPVPSFLRLGSIVFEATCVLPCGVL